jgi:hypothetical protein
MAAKFWINKLDAEPDMPGHGACSMRGNADEISIARRGQGLTDNDPSQNVPTASGYARTTGTPSPMNSAEWPQVVNAVRLHAA